ncbi:glycosyltransferase family 2 protein [Moorena sp. SIO3H5]|uniref:glycosyltransferase family 2 protein n=1 Tax=Moorena sp. SIO3H5 TaxID=2607834 RepID=UPI0013BB363E|nr:glycosyltransferase family 2 protein [Moorena sp. SIO3H5]NEO68922.1 glycosyltransferase family 2 protein [Moorena sp. SIO3H5]
MISIVIANYNKAPFITQTIKSVINQSCANWEVIFVDDGSTDNSLQIALQLASQDRRICIEHTKKEKRGANAARNIGWKASKFDYILFLDSDDVLAPHCIENRLNHIQRNKLDFNVFTGGTFLYQVGDKKEVWRPKNSKYHLESFLRHDLPWNITSVLWSKDSLHQINGFDEDLPRLQDVDLHTRALLFGLKYFVIEDEFPDFFYRVSLEKNTFNAYDLGKKYVTASTIFQQSIYRLIQSSNYEKNLKKRYIRCLRGTTLSIMYRFAIEASKGFMNDTHKYELQEALQNSFISSLIFDGSSKTLLEIYKFILNAGFWKIRGFTKLTKFLIS